MTADTASPALYVLWLGEAASGTTLPGVRIQRASAELPLSWILALAPDLIVASSERAEELAFQLGEARPDLCIPVISLGSSGGELARRRGIVALVDPDADVGSVVISALGKAASRPRWSVGGNYASTLRGRAGLVFSSSAAVAIDAAGRRAPHRTLEGDLTFAERAPASVTVLEAAREGGVDHFLDGARIALLDEEPGRWKTVVDSLASAGAQAHAESDPTAVQALDPSVIVIAEAALSMPLATALDEDPRLSAASLLVVRGELDAASVCSAVAELCKQEIAIAHRLAASERVVDRIEALGPARWLKIVARLTEATALELHGAAGIGQIQLAGGKIRDATFASRDGAAIEPGRPAIQAMLAMTYGTVLAGPKDAVAQGRPVLEPKLATTPPTRRSTKPRAPAPAPIEEEKVEEKKEKPAKRAKKKRAAEPEPSPRPDVSQDVTEMAGEPSPRPSPAEAAPIPTPEPAAARPEESSRSAWTWLVLAAALVGVAVLVIWWGGPSSGEPAAPTTAAPPAIEPNDQAARAENRVPPRPRRRAGDTTVASDDGSGTSGDTDTTSDEQIVVSDDTDTTADEQVGVADDNHTTSDEQVVVVDDTDTTSDEQGVVSDDNDTTPDEQAVAPSDNTAASGDSPDVTRMVIRLRAAQEARDYARMRTLAQEVLRQRPQNASAAYYMALSLLRTPGGTEQDHDEAVQWAHRAQQWDPHDARPWLLEGDIHHQHGHPNAARAAWEQCLRVNPATESCRSRLASE